MTRYFPLVILACAAVGCHGPLHRAVVGDACLQQSCPPAAAPTAACPPTIEVQTPETIVVRPPTPKVVYEQPAPAQPSPGFGGAPQQQPMQPMGYYPAGGGFGGAGGLMGGEIKDRTRVGIVFESIRIPFPVLRLRAFQQPAEVTFRTQLANPGGFGGAPVMMGAGGFGGVPMGGVPMGGVPAGGFGGAAGGQMVYTGTQYVPMTGTMPVQVPNGGGAVGGGGFGGAAGAGGAGFGGAGGSDTADAVEKLRQKLKECEELQTKLKSLQPSAEKK